MSFAAVTQPISTGPFSLGLVAPAAGIVSASLGTVLLLTGPWMLSSL